MKQRWKVYAGWPLVRRPDGGSHEWLMWACEREGTPTAAESVPENYYYSSAKFYFDGTNTFGMLKHYSGN